MTPTAQAELPPGVHLAGLRSKLVARLTGLTAYQLRYWHHSELLEASLRPGRPGVPRLYSWVDYLRLRLAAHLKAREVPTNRIREAVDFLDANFEGWYLLPDTVSASAQGHVLADIVPGAHPLLADQAGQHVLIWPSALDDLRAPTLSALETIGKRGPLGELHSFDDAVIMDPGVNVAQPTVRGSALETRFVSLMCRDIGEESFAAIYRLDPKVIKRASAFERAVA